MPSYEQGWILGEANMRRSPLILPFFQRCRGSSMSFYLIFWSWTAFLITKNLSHFSHNFQKGRLVKTVSALFNTFDTNNQNISVKKNRILQCLLKTLSTTLESHLIRSRAIHMFFKWSKNYVQMYWREPPNNCFGALLREFAQGP